MTETLLDGLTRLLPEITETSTALRAEDLERAQASVSRLRIAAGALFVDIERKRNKAPKERMPNVAERVADLFHEFELALKHNMLMRPMHYFRTIGDATLASIFVTIVPHNSGSVDNPDRVHRAEAIIAVMEDETCVSLKQGGLKLAARLIRAKES